MMTSRQVIYRTIFRISIGLFGLLFVAGLLYSFQSDHHPPGPALDYGVWVRKLLGRGEYARAAQQMELAMRLDETLARQDAQVAVGQALARSGDLDGAIAAYRKALATDPRNATAHFEIGNALAARGGLQPEIGPKLAWARAGMQRMQGQFDAAIASYREVLAARPDLVDVRFDLGVTLAARGDLEGAAREFGTAVQQRPETARFHNALGMALAQLGRREEAIVAYKRGLTIAPDDTELRRNLALVESRPHGR
jgi:superkiller protein 3